MNRRVVLRGVRRTDTTHPGLWLDKYLLDSSAEAKWRLVSEASGIRVPQVYTRFFERWCEALAAMGAVTRKARVVGRLIVGLGSESVLETAITLHRTYGVPMIPGSALKGLAAFYARHYLDEATWGETSEAYRVVFGTTEEAGYVQFFDALYVPGRGRNQSPLYPDVISVHHPGYYQGNQPSADWDSPVPVPFVSATGTYLLAMRGPEEWVEAVFAILQSALKVLGVGAKTSSGYGRMEFLAEEG